MPVVVDASVIVSALVKTGAEAVWSERVLVSHSLIAPNLVEVEVANILRRLRAAGRLSVDEADQSFRDLTSLKLELQPFAPFAERIWQLKNNVTCYDAWYVAVAEAFHLPIATLDLRLVGASGVHCEFLTPN